jgi:hypothetical protein
MFSTVVLELRGNIQHYVPSPQVSMPTDALHEQCLKIFPCFVSYRQPQVCAPIEHVDGSNRRLLRMRIVRLVKRVLS